MAVMESMNGARFVHDQLELAGWSVEVADVQRAKGLAPLACKTDLMPAEPIVALASSMHAGPGTFALLVGSGISRSAEVPTGWEVSAGTGTPPRAARRVTLVEKLGTGP